MTGLRALVVTALMGAFAVPAAAKTRRYAVVIAHSDDIKRKAASLQYADDDGARYYEMLSQFADKVELYTVLDATSQRKHPLAAAVARVPKKSAVVAGVQQLFRRIVADNAQGIKTEFFFVLIGHGDVGAGGEGYVSLLDAPFTRTDLFHKVLARSPATTNHIIVDACNSYFLVHRRGGSDSGPSRAAALKKFLAREDLRRYPNTGVLLSTSSEKDSHEWSAYEAGVFSHQVRSALSGAADINRDGRIEYSEVAAFIAAANAQIKDRRARVELYARGPAIDLSRPLVSLRESKFRSWLKLPVNGGLRVYLEDTRGVRYADVHTSGKQPVLIGLVPNKAYYVRTTDSRREARVALTTAGRIDFRLANLHPRQLASRGAVIESFQKYLFAEPYGPAFYRGFIANTDHPAVSPGPVWEPAKQLAAYVRQRRAIRQLLSVLDGKARADRVLAEKLRRARPALLEALRTGRLAAARALLERVSDQQ